MIGAKRHCLRSRLSAIFTLEIFCVSSSIQWTSNNANYVLWNFFFFLSSFFWIFDSRVFSLQLSMWTVQCSHPKFVTYYLSNSIETVCVFGYQNINLLTQSLKPMFGFAFRFLYWFFYFSFKIQRNAIKIISNQKISYKIVNYMYRVKSILFPFPTHPRQLHSEWLFPQMTSLFPWVRRPYRPFRRPYHRSPSQWA